MTDVPPVNPEPTPPTTPTPPPAAEQPVAPPAPAAPEAPAASAPTAPPAPGYTQPGYAAPAPAAPGYVAPAAPGYAQPGSAPYAPAAGAPAKTPILSILAIIGGIIGLLGSASGFTLLFSAAGVVLGFMGRRKEPAAKGLWITGIITGFVGIAVNLIVLAVIIISFIAVAASGSSYGY